MKMREGTNLLSETLEAIAPHGPSDVRWVGTELVKFSWDEFAALADVECDAGFGSSKVAQDLLVVGDGWWLERHEYDGSEWWEKKACPVEPQRSMKPVALTVDQAKKNGIECSCGWENLEDLNKAATVPEVQS